MSIFDFLFDSEWQQRSDINFLEDRAKSIEARLSSAQSNSADTQTQILHLRKEMCRMVLVLETLRRIILDKELCTPKEFDRIMRTIDAEDGVIDGMKYTPQKDSDDLQFCRACQRFNPIALKECRFCGKPFATVNAGPPPPPYPWYWVCRTCGRMNSPSSQGCMECGEARDSSMALR
jgi:hypothetical protein